MAGRGLKAETLAVPFPGAPDRALPAWWTPAAATPRPSWAVLLAHGAGASSRHSSMEELARGLSAEGIASLRFDFPYRARRPAGGGPPDRPAVARAALEAAWARLRERAGHDRLLFGGRSFGARMGTLALADGGLRGCRGVVGFSWPLHPAGRPGRDRAAHLADVPCPLFLVRGERDALANPEDWAAAVAPLPGVHVHAFPDGDHALAVRRRSGVDRDAALRDTLHAVRAWVDAGPPPS